MVHLFSAIAVVTTLGSEIKLLLFGSGSREKYPFCLFWDRDLLFVVDAVLFSPLYSSLLHLSPSSALLFELLESVSACASAASL